MKKIAIFLVLALSTVLSLRALTLYTLTTNGFTYNVGAPSQQFGVVSNVYYVNQATGSDSYNGGSTNYPWQHIPGDTTAPGYGLSLTTAPAGSTIYIAGQYTLANAQIYVVGGPTNQPVTYASLPGQRAQIKGSYNTNLYWGPCLNSNIQAFVDVSAHGWSNVVFSNIDIGPIGGSLQVPPTNYFGTGVSAPPATGYGIGCAGAMINTTVVGCTFNGLGYYWNTVPMDASSLSGDGMDIYNFTNVSIINCTFKNARDGIFLGGLQGSGLLISNCNFLDALGWGITAPYLNGEYLDNINIAHCNWTNSDYSFSGPQWSGTGQWVHGNGIFFYGESVVESAGQSFTGGTNIAIHHCHFADPNQNENGGTSAIFMAANMSFFAYDNVFDGIKVANGIISSWDNTITNGSGGSVNIPWHGVVFNNTFTATSNTFSSAAIFVRGDENTGAPYADAFYWTNFSASGWIFYNNIFYATNNSGNSSEPVYMESLTNYPAVTPFIANIQYVQPAIRLNYNSYAGWTNNNTLSYSGSTYSTLIFWQSYVVNIIAPYIPTYFTIESNADFTHIPTFTNHAGYTDQYQLVNNQTNICYGGTNMYNAYPYLPEITLDYYGVARNLTSTTNWSMGATVAQ